MSVMTLHKSYPEGAAELQPGHLIVIPPNALLRLTPSPIECPYCRNLMSRIEGAKRYAFTRTEGKGDEVGGCRIPAKYWVLQCKRCKIFMCCPPPPGEGHA